MTRDDVKKIIDAENLTGYNFFENRDDRENEVVIKYENNMWIVYVTDERSSRIGGPEKQFDTEDKALDNFIKRLRAFNALKKNKLN